MSNVDEAPAWLSRLPLLRRLPPLSRRELRFLTFLAFANFFDHYDMSVLGLALPQIQSSLNISEADLGPLLGLMRVGALGVLLLSVLADRLGRRRLLLVTIVGFTICTGGTALARNLEQFILFQFGARFFVGAEALLSVVVLTEELAATNRGFGIGLLGGLAAAGTGFAAIVFGFVDRLPFGWRALYAFGAVPLALIAWYRRGLPETERFARLETRRNNDTSEFKAAFRLLRDALVQHPAHAIAMALIVMSFEFAQGTAYLLGAKYLQEGAGFSPPQVALLVVGGGAVATLGAVYIGLLSDRIGRRVTLMVTIAVDGLSIVGLYNLSGWSITVCWTTMIFSGTASTSNIQVLGAELFPTAHRSTASGVRLVLGTLGGAAGLAVEGLLYRVTHSHAIAVSCLAAALLVALPALWFVRETAGVELDEDAKPG